MESDLLFIVTYECPRCHVDLEARATGSPHWLRCPRCGRASLPPEYDRIAPPPEFIDKQETLFIGSFTTGPDPLPVRPRSMAPLPRANYQKTPNIRVLLGVVFFMATLLFLFSLLGSNGVLATFSGVAAAVTLFLLTRPVGREYRD